MTALRYDQRPPDRTPVHTDELPDTPTRDRNIMASAWVEAPPELLTLGDNLDGQPEAEYKRRIGEWLLWRSGPAVDADAVYLAVHRSDLSRQHRFTLLPDGRGRVVNGGIGVEPEVEQPDQTRARPSGERRDRS